MQPYQQASQEFNRQSSRQLQAASAIPGAVASTVAGGRILSMLSQYIPPGLAAKGLAKIDPRLGKFAGLAQEAGHSFDDVKSFISDKVQQGQEPVDSMLGQLEGMQSQLDSLGGPPKQNRNIIEQYSPELHQFIDQEIKKGRSPIEAGALAQNDKRFKKVIDKLSKDHKTPWSNILQSVYSGTQQTPSQPQQMQQGQPAESGQGQQALMAILQKLQQARGMQ